MPRLGPSCWSRCCSEAPHSQHGGSSGDRRPRRRRPPPMKRRRPAARTGGGRATATLQVSRSWLISFHFIHPFILSLTHSIPFHSIPFHSIPFIHSLISFPFRSFPFIHFRFSGLAEEDHATLEALVGLLRPPAADRPGHDRTTAR